MELKRLKIVIVLNSLIVIGEIVAGLISGSVALMVDALHNFGDVLAVLISYIAIVYSSKSPDYRYTFGYHRAEMMAAFVNAIFLIIAMGFVLVEAFRHLITPVAIEAEWMIAVATVALVINAYSAKLLHQGGHHHHHHHHHDDHHHHDHNIHAAYLHMLGDALLSLGVIVGGIMIYFFNTPYVDALLALFFGLYILYQTWPVLKKAFESLMDRNTIAIEPLAALLLEFEEVINIHDLHVTQPSSKEVHLQAHVVLGDDLTLERIEALIEAMRLALKEQGITHSVLQPESRKYAQESILCSSHH